MYIFNDSNNKVFNLPQKITSVGNNFCAYMFSNCANLKMNDVFNLPQDITEVGTSFCINMFRNCKNISSLSDESTSIFFQRETKKCFYICWHFKVWSIYIVKMKKYH